MPLIGRSATPRSPIANAITCATSALLPVGMWASAPWLAYRGIATRPTIPGAALGYLDYLEFVVCKPDGSTFPTSLAAMALEQAISVDGMVDALTELERAGLLRWRPETQTAELTMESDNLST